MSQDFYEENRQPPRRGRPAGRGPKRTARMDLLVVQLILCAVILLAAVGLKLVGGAAYDAVRDAYRLRVCDRLNLQTVVDVLSPAVEDPSALSEPDSAVEDPAPPVSPPGSTVREEETAPSVPDGEGGGEEDAAACVEQYEEAAPALTVWRETYGELILPVEGRLTSPFGWRDHPVTGNRSLHGGVDLAVSVGTPVTAAADGAVRRAGYDTVSGWYLLIDHAGELSTLYAHCDSLLAAEGDAVTQGQTVALSGSTGLATGPHLHFEVRLAGQKLDPAWALELPAAP